MIVDGIHVPVEHCEVIGKALLVAQEVLRRDGIVSPVVAKYTEEALSVARSRRNLDAKTAGRASSETRSLPFGRLVGAREAKISRWSIRSVQCFAASGAIGRRVDGRYVFTEGEVEDLARRRRAGPVGGAADGRRGGADAAAGGRPGP
jgi:hypothetical protein